MELHSFEFELLPDERIQINSSNYHVAAQRAGRTLLEFECAAKFMKNFERKKCDLALVVILVIEKPIITNPATSDAFHRRNLSCRMVVWFAAVMAEEVVSGRDVKVTDFHRDK